MNSIIKGDYVRISKILEKYNSPSSMIKEIEHAIRLLEMHQNYILEEKYSSGKLLKGERKKYKDTINKYLEMQSENQYLKETLQEKRELIKILSKENSRMRKKLEKK